MNDTTQPEHRHDPPSGEGAVPQDAVDPPAAGLTLAQRLVRGSSWTLVGHFLGNVFRLAGNLVMTRLLFPEAFGLMALVNSFIWGLHMFSDVGIAPSIIQNPRGTERAFRHTAWTLQALRGVFLFFCACLLAWPIAAFYGEPMLRYLLPVAAGTALLNGFNSTKLVTLNRQIEIGRLVAMDLGCQVVTLSSMIVWAYIVPSVWALVAGSIIGASLRLLASHLYLPGERDWFRWERESVRELIHFGRWIFPSTIMSFISDRSDRLILGRFMVMAQLGVYNIAFFLATALSEIVTSLGRRVLFPYYARLSEESPQELGPTIARIRLRLLALTLAPLAGVIAWGPSIVHLLYDARYQGAGWMLQILAAGSAPKIISLTAEPVVLARGDSFRHMLVMTCNAASLILAMGIGGYVWGSTGLVVGVAVTFALSYPATAWAVHKHGVWQPKIDLGMLIATGILAALLSLIPLPF